MKQSKFEKMLNSGKMALLSVTNKCFWISISDVLNFKQHLALAVDLFWFV